MIERVARAIEQSFFGSPLRPETSAELRETVLETARAAIEVMREPTEAMVEAMEGSDFESWSPEPGEGRDSINLDEAWRAGVDAALKDELRATVDRRVFTVDQVYPLPKGMESPRRLPHVYAGRCPFRWDKGDGLDAWKGTWRIDGAGLDPSRSFKVTSVESYALHVIREGSPVALLVEEIEP
jgi:hypothetical protein